MQKFFVYILESLKDNKLYTGCTSDICKRLHAHNSGKVKSTQKRRPFKVGYFEEYSTLIEARRRERYLKTLKGGILKRQLVDNFSKELLNRLFNSNNARPCSESKK